MEDDFEVVDSSSPFKLIEDDWRGKLPGLDDSESDSTGSIEIPLIRWNIPQDNENFPFIGKEHMLQNVESNQTTGTEVRDSEEAQNNGADKKDEMGNKPFDTQDIFIDTECSIFTQEVSINENLINALKIESSESIVTVPDRTRVKKQHNTKDLSASMKPESVQKAKALPHRAKEKREQNKYHVRTRSGGMMLRPRSLPLERRAPSQKKTSVKPYRAVEKLSYSSSHIPDGRTARAASSRSTCSETTENAFNGGKRGRPPKVSHGATQEIRCQIRKKSAISNMIKFHSNLAKDMNDTTLTAELMAKLAKSKKALTEMSAIVWGWEEGLEEFDRDEAFKLLECIRTMCKTLRRIVSRNKTTTRLRSEALQIITDVSNLASEFELFYIKVENKIHKSNYKNNLRRSKHSVGLSKASSELCQESQGSDAEMARSMIGLTVGESDISPTNQPTDSGPEPRSILKKPTEYYSPPKSRLTFSEEVSAKNDHDGGERGVAVAPVDDSDGLNTLIWAIDYISNQSEADSDKENRTGNRKETARRKNKKKSLQTSKFGCGPATSLRLETGSQKNIFDSAPNIDGAPKPQNRTTNFKKYNKKKPAQKSTSLLSKEPKPGNGQLSENRPSGDKPLPEERWSNNKLFPAANVLDEGGFLEVGAKKLVSAEFSFPENEADRVRLRPTPVRVSPVQLYDSVPDIVFQPSGRPEETTGLKPAGGTSEFVVWADSEIDSPPVRTTPAEEGRDTQAGYGNPDEQHRFQNYTDNDTAADEDCQIISSPNTVVQHKSLTDLPDSEARDSQTLRASGPIPCREQTTRSVAKYCDGNSPRITLYDSLPDIAFKPSGRTEPTSILKPAGGTGEFVVWAESEIGSPPVRTTPAEEGRDAQAGYGNPDEQHRFQNYTDNDTAADEDCQIISSPNTVVLHKPLTDHPYSEARDSQTLQASRPIPCREQTTESVAKSRNENYPRITLYDSLPDIAFKPSGRTEPTSILKPAGGTGEFVVWAESGIGSPPVRTTPAEEGRDTQAGYGNPDEQHRFQNYTDNYTAADEDFQIISSPNIVVQHKSLTDLPYSEARDSQALQASGPIPWSDQTTESVAKSRDENYPRITLYDSLPDIAIKPSGRPKETTILKPAGGTGEFVVWAESEIGSPPVRTTPAEEGRDAQAGYGNPDEQHRFQNYTDNDTAADEDCQIISSPNTVVLHKPLTDLPYSEARDTQALQASGPTSWSDQTSRSVAKSGDENYPRITLYDSLPETCGEYDERLEFHPTSESKETNLQLRAQDGGSVVAMSRLERKEGEQPEATPCSVPNFKKYSKNAVQKQTLVPENRLDCTGAGLISVGNPKGVGWSQKDNIPSRYEDEPMEVTFETENDERTSSGPIIPPPVTYRDRTTSITDKVKQDPKENTLFGLQNERNYTERVQNVDVDLLGTGKSTNSDTVRYIERGCSPMHVVERSETADRSKSILNLDRRTCTVEEAPEQTPRNESQFKDSVLNGFSVDSSDSNVFAANWPTRTTNSALPTVLRATFNNAKYVRIKTESNFTMGDCDFSQLWTKPEEIDKVCQW